MHKSWKNTRKKEDASKTKDFDDAYRKMKHNIITRKPDPITSVYFIQAKFMCQFGGCFSWDIRIFLSCHLFKNYPAEKNSNFKDLIIPAGNKIILIFQWKLMNHTPFFGTKL